MKRHLLVDTKYLIVDWHPKRPDGRHFKVRRNLRVHNVYVQVFALEVVLWWR